MSYSFLASSTSVSIGRLRESASAITFLLPAIYFTLKLNRRIYVSYYVTNVPGRSIADLFSYVTNVLALVLTKKYVP